MDRPKCTVSRVADYRRYHLSGDLEEMVQGKVIQAINKLSLSEQQNNGMVEESHSDLTSLVESQNENNLKLQGQVEEMKLRNQLEVGQMQQEQWELAIDQLKMAWQAAAKEHQKNMNTIREMTKISTSTTSNQAVAWLATQLDSTSMPTLIQKPSPNEKTLNGSINNISETGTPPPTDTKQLLLAELKAQQAELQKRIEEVTATNTTPQDDLVSMLRQAIASNNPKTEQELLMEQIRTTLGKKEEERDPNKALLKALITAQNKATGPYSTSTLKPDILHKLTNDEFSMAEWLASLNKQEEGESEISKLLAKHESEESDCRLDCKHAKKSGMLDKSTANIQRKEVWPQKKLGEDWAEDVYEATCSVACCVQNR